MRTLVLKIVVALLVTAVVAMPAHAQRRRMRGGRAMASTRPEVGAHLGYNFDADNAVIGAQASFPITPQVDLYPSFDYYTVSNATEWALNFDARLRPIRASRYWYVGSGLNVLHVSAGGVSDTKAHLNLLGGLLGPRGRGQMRPYAEARLTVGDGSSFQIVGGLFFALR